MLSRVKSECFGGLGMLGIYGEEKIVEIKCGGPTFCFFGGWILISLWTCSKN